MYKHKLAWHLAAPRNTGEAGFSGWCTGAELNRLTRADCAYFFPNLSSSPSHLVMEGLSPPWGHQQPLHIDSPPLPFPKEPDVKIFTNSPLVGRIYKLYLLIVIATPRPLIFSLILFLFIISSSILFLSLPGSHSFLCFCVS